MNSIHDIADVWTTASSVWERSIFGLTVGHLVLSLLILAVALLLRRIFGRMIVSRIHAWSSHAAGGFNREIVDSLLQPIQFIPLVVAISIIAEFVLTNPRLKESMGQIDRSLIVFIIFWAMIEVIAPLCAVLDGRTPIFSQTMIGWTVRVGRAIIVTLGVAAVLEIWGIHVGPILASFGLIGVAVALGAQNLFKNLISGIFIIGEQRFRNGDWILAEGVVEGTVETIGLRTTKVRRFDDAPVFVPNSYLADNAVTNFSQMGCRRISWVIGLEYRTSADQLHRIRDGIEAHILSSDEFVHPPTAVAFVRVDKFNDSSIDLMVYCFTRTTDWGEWLKIKEELVYAIKLIVAEAGSDFAFPTRSLYMEIPPGSTGPFPHAHTSSDRSRDTPRTDSPS